MTDDNNLDADPGMLTTWENRRIFRLAKERIAELRQLITELEVKNDGLETAARLLEKAGKRLGRDVDNSLTDYHDVLAKNAELKAALKEALLMPIQLGDDLKRALAHAREFKAELAAEKLKRY